MLQVQEQRAWHDIVTLGESWFCSSTDPERGHVSAQCKQVMVTIVWNPTGFHVMRILPSECKFNSSYYQNEILGTLSEWRSEPAGVASHRLIVHADNARGHTAAAAASQKFMEENMMIRASIQPDLSRRMSHRVTFISSVM
jgi:hypothetical protein